MLRASWPVGADTVLTESAEMSDVDTSLQLLLYNLDSCHTLMVLYMNLFGAAILF